MPKVEIDSAFSQKFSDLSRRNRWKGVQLQSKTAPPLGSEGEVKGFLSLAKLNGTGNNIYFDIESEYGRDNNLEWCDKMELNLII